MELSQAIEILSEFDCMECRFPTCVTCEINYSDIQAIKVVLKELEKLQKEAEQ